MSLRSNEKAASPSVAILLMVAQTVILMVIIAHFSFSFSIPSKAPFAKIEIIEAKGNIDHLNGNEIMLIHKSGDMLDKNNTKIIIRGTGKEALKNGGSITNASLGSIEITYENLKGNNYGDNGSNKGRILSNGVWHAGDVVMLYGNDGRLPSNDNSVDKKWELKPGTTVKITIIDTKSNHVIAKLSSKVEENH